ncbi:MAG: energy-coupling factor transporter transmembrane protein EcfT, partial [Deferribacteraceae bacterium]|nr:energy-coupling factor transporter transmembrane protein EcfT [Deferribacteraceae bacterium]
MFKLAYRGLDLPIYRLHPAAKMLLSFSFVLAAGLAHSLGALAVLAAIFLAAALAAGLRFGGMYSLIRPFRFFLIFTFIVQLFLTPMGQWMLPNEQSIINSLFFTGRMVVIIGFSALFAVITPMTDIVRLFHLLFQPLRIIRINPADTAMSMLIALRFIPLLFTEGEKIIDAQRLKGLLPEK